MTDYYQILGLNQDATHEEIREAYRKLALKFHPDKNNGDKYFEEWSKKINEAYDTLGNPDKRKEYDRSQRGNYSNNQGNNNQQSYRDKEHQTLLYLRGRYGEYKKAKDNYKVALKNLNTVSNYSKPNHLSFIKISLGVIGILIGLIGLKNTYGTSNNDVSQQTEVSAITGDEETNETSSQNIDQDDYQENSEESEIDFLEVSQEISQDLVLTMNRAYFYDSPVDEIGNGKYLVRGDKIYATRQYNDFAYTEFQNNEGVITRGWVKKNLFEPYAPPSIDDNEILIDTQIFDDNQAGITDTNPKKKKGIFRKIFGKKNKD